MDNSDRRLLTKKKAPHSKGMLVKLFNFVVEREGIRYSYYLSSRVALNGYFDFFELVRTRARSTSSSLRTVSVEGTT